MDARCYRLFRNVSLYTQYAKGSVVPPSSVFDVKNASVLTLPTPTTVNTVQGGAVMKWNRATLDVDAYYSRFQNPYTSFIDPVTTEAVFTKPGDSKTKGIEAESNIQVGHGFGPYLNATKSKAVYDATGLYVASSPKDTETIRRHLPAQELRPGILQQANRHDVQRQRSHQSSDTDRRFLTSPTCISTTR